MANSPALTVLVKRLEQSTLHPWKGLVSQQEAGSKRKTNSIKFKRARALENRQIDSEKVKGQVVGVIPLREKQAQESRLQPQKGIELVLVQQATDHGDITYSEIREAAPQPRTVPVESNLAESQGATQAEREEQNLASVTFGSVTKQQALKFRLAVEAADRQGPEQASREPSEHAHSAQRQEAETAPSLDTPANLRQLANEFMQAEESQAELENELSVVSFSKTERKNNAADLRETLRRNLLAA